LGNGTVKKDELSGIAFSTQRALARRALSAAYRLEKMVKRLDEEIEKQGGGRLISREDYKAPVTLTRRDAMHFISEMSSIIQGIRELKPN
jgi:hypothetical protein